MSGETPAGSSERQSAPLLDISCRLFGAALLLPGPRLQAQRRHEAVELFRDLYRNAYGDAGWSGIARTWLSALWGAVRNADKPPPRPDRQPRPRRDGTMQRVFYDFKHAARSLRRHPGFASLTATTLALGIGANVAIFSVVYGVVIQPLPYRQADELVYLAHNAPGAGFTQGELILAPGLYRYYRERSRTLESIGAWRYREATLSSHGDPEIVLAASATSSLFRVLRVPAFMGRTFIEEDDAEGAAAVVVLSHALWQRRYGADPDIVGKPIGLWGRPYAVVGVMPQGFGYPDADRQLWFPESIDSESFGGFYLNGTARLRPGITAEDARAELDALIQAMPEAFPGEPVVAMVLDVQLSSVAVPLKEHVVGGVQESLWLLLGAVGLVLLIACANVANLFLVRSEGRQREVAVRAALGAGRGHLVRLSLSESFLLCGGGGLIGLVLAAAGTRLLIAYGPPSIPRLGEISINPAVIGFTALLSLLACLLFGSIPVLRARSELASSLQDGGRASTSSRTRLRARNVLVASQVALALVLLSGALLMAQSYWHLRQLDPGFEIDNVLTFDVSLPAVEYETVEAAVGFHRQTRDRLAALPGVAAAAVVIGLPLSGSQSGDPLVEEGVPFDAAEMPPIVNVNQAGAGYFETLHIPLLEGRLFEAADYEQQRHVAIVSERLADLYWPGESALGRRVSPGIPEDETTWLEIIGVVGDVAQHSLAEAPVPMLYVNLGDYRGNDPRKMSYALRTEASPLGLADLARQTVWDVNPRLPVADMETMARIHRRASASTAFTMTLLLIAAAIALCLGSVGIYGVVAYVVRQRTGEIGVRMALGARAQDVVGLILRQGGMVACVGLGFGLLASLGLTRYLSSLLHGVEPTDPLTHLGVATLLLVVAGLACYIPARRAARIDPVEALRAE